MSGNFLYFNYIKPGTRYYELPDKVDDHTDYILDLPSEDWEIVEFTNWRFYSNSAIRMQDQGWKIHISATTETAEEVLKEIELARENSWQFTQMIIYFQYYWMSYMNV